MGRVWIDLENNPTKMKSPEDGQFYDVYTHKDEKWYDLIFDATNSKEGKLLVGYDIIPLEHRHKVNILLL